MQLRIILTGSTGNLGCYLLEALNNNPSVETIYCLNRSDEARTRQIAACNPRGLSVGAFIDAKESSSSDSDRIRFHTATLSEPDLGLSADIYTQLKATTNLIIHNAWPVDFNRHFDSFAPSIQGVQNLISFSFSSTHQARIFFISSISAAGNWGAVPGARMKVPEQEIDDWKVARLGYGQSKLVSERLLARASQNSGLSCAVCRVGQIAGPVRRGTLGSWPKQEWFPSLVASSMSLGVAPEALGPADNVDWVPVDVLADVMVELVTSLHSESDAKPKTHFYHTANPKVVTWGTLLSALIDYSRKAKKELKVIGMPEWVDVLEKSSAKSSSPADVEQNPAIKLLDFFKNLQDKALRMPEARSVTLDVKKTSKQSASLADMAPVSQDWMQLWLNQWAL